MSEETRHLAVTATQGGAQGFFDLLDEYVVCDHRGFPRPDVPDVVFGREEVVQLYVRWWGTFDGYSATAEDVIASGRTAVVVIEERGRGKGSAIPFEAQHIQVWTFRLGRIIHIEIYRDRNEALEAAGLSE